MPAISQLASSALPLLDFQRTSSCRPRSWHIQPSAHVMPAIAVRCDRSSSVFTSPLIWKAIRFGVMAPNPVRTVAKPRWHALMMLFHKRKAQRAAVPKWFLPWERTRSSPSWRIWQFRSGRGRIALETSLEAHWEALPCLQPLVGPQDCWRWT